MSQTLVAAAEEAPRDADIAFERLYRSSRDDVYAYAPGLLRDRCRRRGGHRDRLRARLPQARPLRPATGRAARLAVRDRPQRGPRRAAPPRPAGRAGRRAGRSTAIGVARAPSRASAASALAAALGALAPRERELIALKFFAGLANAEIAAVLGISESNAGTRLHRAITKLREACNGAV